jgi:hypothetical protein
MAICAPSKLKAEISRWCSHLVGQLRRRQPHSCLSFFLRATLLLEKFLDGQCLLASELLPITE